MRFSTEYKVRLIEQHFAKSKCVACGWVFEPGCISLVSEADAHCVVTVTCTFCKHEAGMAIVGFERPQAVQGNVIDEDMEIPF